MIDRLSQSISGRFVIVGALALFLLIPLAFIDGVANQRQAYYEQVHEEVAVSWGQAQNLNGPFLVVPERFTEEIRNEKGERVTNKRTHDRVFVPQNLEVSAELQHTTRHRSLYDIPVYEAKLKFDGRFGRLEPAREDGQLLFDQARLILGISHTQALSTKPTLRFADESAEFLATTGASWLPSGLHAQVPAGEGQMTFSIDVAIRGTDVLTLFPVADESLIHMRSSWPHPSFYGRYLPSDYQVSEAGFDARWTTHALARNLPSSWWAGESLNMDEEGASVSLFEPITDYRMVDRGIKYGLLFITLTFLAFLSFELVGGLRFHVVQYGVVGLGLTLFYLALLSLSEHINFPAAYLIATLVLTTLTSWYVHSIVKDRKLTASICAAVVALYAVLFVLLTLADYALLAGTGVLFAGLIALMFTTRRLQAIAPSPSITT